jgi:biopolymer transport protein ExbB/TolQ
MRFVTVLLIVTGIAIAGFSFMNRQVFAAPATFHIPFGSFQSSIGAIMLAILALTLLVCAIVMLVWHGALLMSYRRQSKELQTQRALAEYEEASRFSELRTLFNSETTALGTRLEAALDSLRSEIRDTENSISATLGKIDDQLERSMRPAEGPPLANMDERGA